MNVIEAIKQIYPNLTHMVDFRVDDPGDGNGPRLVMWNNPNPQPTQSQLDAQAVLVAKKEKREQLILAFDAEYDALWTIAGQEIGAIKDRILFKTAAQRTAAENVKVTSASNLINKIETKLTDVNNATTQAQVASITW